MTKIDFKKIFKDILSSDFEEVIESKDLITPYFVDEFNLSAGHQFVLPTLHNNNVMEASNRAIIQWCIRKDDISRVGYTNRHLSSFEMAVFGRFGFIDNRLETQIFLLNIFLKLMRRFLINTEQLYFTITEGAKILDREFPLDEISYNALKGVGIPDNRIITTKGRQNFVFSNGQDRASGYNIEIFYKLDNEFVEIASSNIYEYVLDGCRLVKKTNMGIGVGIGIERLLMIINNDSTIYNLLNIDKAKYEELLGGCIQYNLAKSKIIRIEELSKTINLIDDMVFREGIPINYKQKKSYNFIKAKFDSEVNYLQVVNKITVT